MYDVAQENKRLTGPLQTALAEAEQLKKKNEDLTELNAQLQNATQNAEQRAKRIQDLEWENDMLKTALRDTGRAKDDLDERFQQAI